MNDNELIAWQVVDSCNDVLHTCLIQGTAEYLRDWYEAIEINNFTKNWKVPVTKYNTRCLPTNKFSVNECEVIVG